MIYRQRRTALWMSAVAATALTAAGVVITANAAQAAAGCRIDYTVSTQWSGGFTASVNLTNLGDPLSAWTTTWTFGAGQRVDQGWNATFTQNGSAVSAGDAGYNGAVATNGTVSFGFNGTWTGSNPVPTNFAVNGVACTGGVTPTTGVPTTPPPTTAPPTTPPPTTPPPTTPPPTTPPPTTPPPSGSTLYVAPNGSAGAAGTQANPTTLASAITRVTAGGTIYVRAGTYNLAQTVTIAPGNNGTVQRPQEAVRLPGREAGAELLGA